MTDGLTRTLATIFERWRAGETQENLEHDYGLEAGALKPLATLRRWQETLALSRKARDEAEQRSEKNERDRCAKIAESYGSICVFHGDPDTVIDAGYDIAKRIRETSK